MTLKENKIKSLRKRDNELALNNITWPALALLTLSACSTGGIFRPFKLFETDNHPPVAAVPTTNIVAEDSSNNPLGIQAPTDSDNDALTITVNGVPSGGTVTTSGGVVVTVGSTLSISQLTGLVFTPDPNTNSDLADIGVFRYTVSDNKGGTASSTVTITVTPVADAPTITSSNIVSIKENDSAVITVVGDDVDQDTLTYTVTGGADQDLFTVDSATGALSFKNKPDFENPSDSDGDNIYTVEVTADDGTGNTVSQTIQVTVTDVVTMIAITNSTINENDGGAVVGALSSVIDNTAATDSFTYALSGTDADSFEVVDGQLKLKDSVSANYESQNSYSVTVTATDTGGLTASQTFTVTVSNVNDAPTLANAIADQSVDEDSAFSFTVPADTFNDEDGDTLTYTVTLSNGSALPSWLSFDTATQTFTGTPLNGDVGSISVTVTATDAAGVAVSDIFAIAVANTNDAPTAIALSSLGVPEKIDGAVVGTLTTTDVDVDDTHTYTVSDDRFEVVDGQLKLKAGNTVEYATEATITITVTTTDAAGESFDQEFTLTVGSIQISATTFAENAAGVVIGDLSMTDPDFTTNVTYTLSGDDADSFEVVNSQLKLKDSVSADFETKNSYSITITATDDAGHETTLTYSLQVTDINETPTAIALSATAIDENAAGAVIGDLTTSDVDAGDTHTYTLSGTDAESFEVVNGQLKLKDSVTADYETQSSYSVTVTATDSGSLTTTQDFTVNVNNLNDNDPVITSNSSISMEENSNSVITVTATDADGDSLTYSITGGDDSSLFTIDATTGVLTLQAKTDGLTTTESTLPITLTNMVDNGDGTYTADIEVDPAFASFAALAGITIWFSFDSSEMNFTKNDVLITYTEGVLDQVSTLSDGRIKLLWLDTTNTFEAGKIGTITFTPTAGATDPTITIEAQLIGGDKDSIDATKSIIDTTIYNFTIIRTNVDFENPADSDSDNVYKVTIQVSDGEKTASQDIEVTVTDVSESSKPISDNTDDNDSPNPNPDDDTNPNPDGDTTLPDIGLPTWSLWMENFNFSFITLPETVVLMEDATLPNLSGLVGLLDDQSESLQLDFDQVNTGSSVVASVESVKPVIVDWIAHNDPIIDSDWNLIIEELYYTSEVG